MKPASFPGPMEHVCVISVTFFSSKIYNYRSALYDDACLYVVPRSHRYVRTDEQRALSSTREPPRDPLDMPGVKQIHLKGQPTYPNVTHIGKTRFRSGRNRLLQLEHASLCDI